MPANHVHILADWKSGKTEIHPRTLISFALSCALLKDQLEERTIAVSSIPSWVRVLFEMTSGIQRKSVGFFGRLKLFVRLATLTPVGVCTTSHDVDTHLVGLHSA